MILEKILRSIVIAGVFALPFICFIIAQNLFFPYITGKNFTFRIIVEIIAGATLALALVDPAYRPRRSWILAAFSLFVLIIAIADAQGAYPFKSFWSNYERMDGWVTLAHLLLYFLVAVSIINTEKLWRRLFHLSLAISMVVGLYGLLQIFGIAALGGVGQEGQAGLSARVDARFGNPIYLAAYMLFHIFIAAMLWVQLTKEKAPGQRFPLALFYGSAIGLDFIVFLFTGTRGTLIGLVGGSLLALVLYALSSESSRRFKQVTGGAIVCVIAFLAKDTGFVQKVGFLNRIATISLHDRTIEARFLNMSIAWQGVKERPLLGWGQENYALVFDKYYDPRMYDQEPWFDRVHDVIFDWWIAAGTLGLLAYLSIFAAIFWTIWRSSAFAADERSILTGLMVGYFFHNLFVFDNVISYILFVTMIAYIAWRAGTAQKGSALFSHLRLPEATLPFAAAFAALLVWGGAWFVNAAPLAQNRALLQALPRSQDGLSASLELFKKAIAYDSYGNQEAREQLIQTATQLAGLQLDASIKQAYFTSAAEQMTLQANASPLDARFPLFLGILFQAYGDYVDADTAFGRAHELSPKKQSILYSIAQNQEVQGKTADAIQTFKVAFELAPENTQARILYAEILIRAKKDALADEILAPLIETGEAANPRIAAAYVARGEYGKLVKIYEAHVKAQPTDMQGYFTLAAAYYGAGNRTKAIEILRSAEALFPSLKGQAESLIEQIRTGTAKIQ